MLRPSFPGGNTLRDQALPFDRLRPSFLGSNRLRDREEGEVGEDAALQGRAWGSQAGGGGQVAAFQRIAGLEPPAVLRVGGTHSQMHLEP